MTYDMTSMLNFFLRIKLLLYFRLNVPSFVMRLILINFRLAKNRRRSFLSLARTFDQPQNRSFGGWCNPLRFFADSEKNGTRRRVLWYHMGKTLRNFW